MFVGGEEDPKIASSRHGQARLSLVLRVQMVQPMACKLMAMTPSAGKTSPKAHSRMSFFRKRGFFKTRLASARISLSITAISVCILMVYSTAISMYICPPNAKSVQNFPEIFPAIAYVSADGQKF